MNERVCSTFNCKKSMVCGKRVEFKGWKTGRKLTRRITIECKQTRQIITDSPEGLRSANQIVSKILSFSQDKLLVMKKLK